MCKAQEPSQGLHWDGPKQISASLPRFARVRYYRICNLLSAADSARGKLRSGQLRAGHMQNRDMDTCQAADGTGTVKNTTAKRYNSALC